MSSLSRRTFLAGCSAAIAAMSGARLTDLVFAAPSSASAGADVLVSIFLRGGLDGLNLCIPYFEDRYYQYRPDIRVRPPGRPNGALDLDGRFGLHPAANELHTLYQAGKLAIVHATGLTDPTRSHFDAMAMMERGTPGNKTLGTGWLTRHLRSTAGTAGEIRALAASNLVPTSLLGALHVAAVPRTGGLDYWGEWSQVEAQRLALRRMYDGSTWIQQSGTQALDIIDQIAFAGASYTPQFGAVYPGNGFGDALQAVAQLIKLQIGLQVAAVDLGGWDTHEHQGNDGQGQFAALVDTLSQGLTAFYTDLTNYVNSLTIVVMSEFGRRVRENGSEGTDHGHGNVMLVLGGGINGGKVYGTWPGLAEDQLDERQDLRITTDYRQVLGEIIMRRLKNPRLADVFPGMPPYAPLGLAQGTDLPIPPPSLSLPPTAAESVFIPVASR
ncbi:MAG: DUF1501 domain-containing protein [Chloroflexota bacterium]|nr:DUF1501 domain-containing protein [Dehalococcoidia bacterium]MDW8255153.1 DUF1501 domain-containing protein [Chloroflexota bacterium]